VATHIRVHMQFNEQYILQSIINTSDSFVYENSGDHFLEYVCELCHIHTKRACKIKNTSTL